MKIRRTATLNEILQKADQSNVLDIDPCCIGDDWIDHEYAVRLGRAHQLPLSDVLRGTEVYVSPFPAVKPKTPEYVELMQTLRIAEEERKYQSLLGDRKSDSLSLNLKSVSDEINNQLTTIFNVLVSIGAVGWAFWYWCSNWPLGGRTLMSLFAAGLAGVAEVVVYTGYLRRVEESKKRSRKQAESKRVIKEYVFQGGKEIAKPRESEKVVEKDPKKPLGRPNHNVDARSENGLRHRAQN